jgi:hypothetical protein
VIKVQWLSKARGSRVLLANRKLFLQSRGKIGARFVPLEKSEALAGTYSA